MRFSKCNKTKDKVRLEVVLSAKVPEEIQELFHEALMKHGKAHFAEDVAPPSETENLVQQALAELTGKTDAYVPDWSKIE